MLIVGSPGYVKLLFNMQHFNVSVFVNYFILVIVIHCHSLVIVT